MSRIVRLDSSKAILLRLLVVAVLVLATPLALVTILALNEFEHGMSPEMDRKAAVVVRDVVGQVERAVGSGIPLEKLVGVDDFFGQILSANQEIRYIGITDKTGRILFLSGARADELAAAYQNAPSLGQDERKTLVGNFVDVAMAVDARGGAVGQVHVGFEKSYITGRLFGILTDIGVVAGVSLVVAFEILMFVVVFNISGPLKLAVEIIKRGKRGDFSVVPGATSLDEVGRLVRALSGAVRHVDESYRRLAAYIDEVRTGHFDREVAEKVGGIADRVRFLFRFNAAGKPQMMRERLASDVRLPLFLFVFAEELSRSFMPLYAQARLQPLFGLPEEVLIALPVTVFMAAIAAASLWAGAAAERVGNFRLFQIGVVPALGGALLSGFAQNIAELIAYRALSGIGYALVTVACQSYISQTAVDGSRTKGMGGYVGAVLTAALCGTAGGSVLADRIGQDYAFFMAAALVFLSGLLLARLLASTQNAAQTGSAAESAAGNPMRLMRVFANWRFTVLVSFAAIPAKIALAGFLFFLTPLLLWRQGLSLPDIGRIMALYPLVMLGVMTLSSKLADELGWRVGQVALGGLIGGLGMLSALVFDGTISVVIAVIALGVSHGMSAAPQLALIPDICWTECRNHGQARILALVRTLERVGSLLGPLLAAIFLPLWGESGAMIALGALVLAMSFVFAVVSGAYGNGPHLEPEEEDAA